MTISGIYLQVIMTLFACQFIQWKKIFKYFSRRIKWTAFDPLLFPDIENCMVAKINRRAQNPNVLLCSVDLCEQIALVGPLKIAAETDSKIIFVFRWNLHDWVHSIHIWRKGLWWWIYSLFVFKFFLKLTIGIQFPLMCIFNR